jgi:hypothetical protein
MAMDAGKHLAVTFRLLFVVEVSHFGVGDSSRHDIRCRLFGIKEAFGIRQRSCLFV